MIIKIENLYVRLGDRDILKGVNFNVSRGENFVILGPSGSGKTVLLKTLLGLMKPSSGKLVVLGHDMFNITDKELFEIRKKTGMVFQNAALFDSMMVWENVGFALIEHLKLSKEEIRKKAQQALMAVGLFDILDKIPEQLSGGMRKRVGIARALIGEPEILFYDEPTAGLDVITSSGILNLMKKIHSEFSTTDVIVTHDLTIARDFADRIAIINDGVILATGRWEELLKSENDFVKYFLNVGADHEKHKF
ncbi:MAG: ATP-binding cassette domain-containing protein [Candidatus Omnitrophica bacterium]|nr:ATP-binding cassette domain-containing protein [Candidatus Omnitrophota bacterium]